MVSRSLDTLGAGARLALRRLATSRIADLSGWVRSSALMSWNHQQLAIFRVMRPASLMGERHKRQSGNNEESDRERRRLDEDFAVRKGPGESPLRPV